LPVMDDPHLRALLESHKSGKSIHFLPSSPGQQAEALGQSGCICLKRFEA